MVSATKCQQPGTCALSCSCGTRLRHTGDVSAWHEDDCQAGSLVATSHVLADISDLQTTRKVDRALHVAQR
jgi:hypothetical protein